MTGCWVFVCGPSGAGKDSVLGWARDALALEPRVVFARRLVTRPPQGAADHDEVSPAAFERLRAAGRLAWHWEAHGFHYGVDAAHAAQVDAGRVVVVNGSREHVASLLPDPARRVVLVTAGATHLAARLQAREREDAGAIARRLARNDTLAPLSADLEIANEGPLEQAGRRLTGYLQALALARSLLSKQ